MPISENIGKKQIFVCFLRGILFSRGNDSSLSADSAKPPMKRCLSCSPIDCENSIVFCGRFMNRPYDDCVIFCRGHSRMTRGESCGKRCRSCSPIDCGNLFGFLDRRGRRSLRVLHEFYCSLARRLVQKNGVRSFFLNPVGTGVLDGPIRIQIRSDVGSNGFSPWKKTIPCGYPQGANKINMQFKKCQQVLGKGFRGNLLERRFPLTRPNAS